MNQQSIFQQWQAQGQSRADWFGDRFDPSLDQLNEIRAALEGGSCLGGPEGVGFFLKAGKRWFSWAQEDHPEDATTIEQWAEMVRHYGAVLA